MANDTRNDEDAYRPETTTNDPIPSTEAESSPAALSRRRFLGTTGGVTAGSLVLGSAGVTALGAAAPDALAQPAARGRGRGRGRETRDLRRRAQESFRIRVDAARDERRRPLVRHPTNGDEQRFPTFIGNFSKSLPHNDLGEVDPGAYRALVAAVEAGDLDAVEAAPAGGPFPLLNPLGGLTFTIEGGDGTRIFGPRAP